MRIARRAGGVDIGIGGVSGAVLIGQGGFGVVYRAEHRAFDRTVAVKILSAPGFDDDTWYRFERECAAIEALAGHPHVVAILDSGINEWGRPFLVMEYMARGSIADGIATRGPVAWPTAIEIGLKIASAVSASHAAGILHRDIKPQNVLLSAYDEPKLGDFGIASLIAEQSNSGSIAASLEHAAPELLDGNRATRSSDIYALASTIFTMIEGRSPFARREGETIQSVVARIVTDPVPDLRPQGVPGPVCDALERGLAKDPSARFGSADELSASLLEIAEHHGLDGTALPPVGRPSVSAGATGPTRPRLHRAEVATRPRRKVRRSRAVLAAAIAVLFGAAGTSVALIRDDAGRVERPTRPQTTVAAPEVPAESERPATTSAEKNSTRRDDRKRRPSTRNDPIRVAYGSGTTVAPAPPVQAPVTSSDSTKQEARKPVKEQRPEPPPPPPAPDLTMYHAMKRSDHANFTDPARIQGFRDRGFTVETVGGVYSYEAEGTKPITVNGTTLYVFAYGRGETQPETTRVELYFMTSQEGDDFYTSDRGTHDIYYSRGWEAQRLGWVAS